MKICVVGKESDQFSTEIREFLKRISGYRKVSLHCVSPGKGKNPQSVVEIEGEKILKSISQDSCIVAMDISGKSYSSETFADWLELLFSHGQNPTFVIGGAYGLSSKVVEHSHYTLSLSKMTLPHRVALLLLVEQVYRACTILAHHPYHK